MFGDGLTRKTAGIPEVGLAILCGLAVVSGTVATIGWVIVFDTFGWDTVLPSVVFVTVLPSLTVAIVPGIAAKYLYGNGAGLKVGMTTVVATLAFIEYARWTSNNCMMC